MMRLSELREGAGFLVDDRLEIRVRLFGNIGHSYVINLLIFLHCYTFRRLQS